MLSTLCLIRSFHGCICSRSFSSFVFDCSSVRSFVRSFGAFLYRTVAAAATADTHRRWSTVSRGWRLACRRSTAWLWAAPPSEPGSTRRRRDRFLTRNPYFCDRSYFPIYCNLWKALPPAAARASRGHTCPPFPPGACVYLHSA